MYQFHKEIMEPWPVYILAVELRNSNWRLIDASFSRSRFISYSSYNVWNWASSASARAAAPGVLSNSSWAYLSNAQWRSRWLCRAGVTVGALEANVNDD